MLSVWNVRLEVVPRLLSLRQQLTCFVPAVFRCSWTVLIGVVDSPRAIGDETHWTGTANLVDPFALGRSNLTLARANCNTTGAKYSLTNSPFRFCSHCLNGPVS